MIVITVARKPLCKAEGSVAKNVLKHGTGGINIDATRIVTKDKIHVPQSNPGNRIGTVGVDFGISRATVGKFQAAQAASIQRTLDQGRWPANLILSHLQGCQRNGTKQVKVKGSTGHARHQGANTAVLQVPHGNESTGYNSPDGTQTVENWQCLQGCPVAALDQQTGLLHSQDPRTRDGALGKRTTHFSVAYLPTKIAVAGAHYGDVGGASRFFKQVKSS